MLVSPSRGQFFRLRLLLWVAFFCAGESAYCGSFHTATAGEPEKTNPAAAVECFRKGIAAFRQGKFGEAVEWIRQSNLDASPAWEEYGRYYLARSLLEMERPSEALEEAGRFLKRFSESPLLDRVKVLEAQALLATGAYGAAQEACQTLVKTQDRAGVRLLLGQALEAQGDLSAALEQYLRVRRNWPLSPEDRQARKRQNEILSWNRGLDARASVASRLEEAFLCTQEQAFEEALGLYRALLAAPLDAEAERAARAGLIRALVRTGRLADSEKELELLTKRFPGSRETVGSMLSVGSALWNRNQRVEAFSLLRKLLENHTDTEEARQASFAMGRILLEQGNLQEAVDQFRRTRFLFPKTAMEAEASWWEGWCWYLLGEYRTCARHLKVCLEGGLWPANGVERNRALYWEARCLEKSGDPETGRVLYGEILKEGPADYYGILAEKRLAAGPFVLGFEGSPDPKFLTALEAPALSCRIPDSVLPVLIDVGLAREAAERLDWLRLKPGLRDLPAEQWIEAYAWAGAYRNALQIAQPLWPALRLAELREARAFRTQIPSAVRLGVYPLAYWDLVRNLCVERGLDPFLVLGLMKQESLFVPDIASPAGAVGLMQIMPATASTIARELGLMGFRTALLQEPEINLRIGTAYLASLVERFGAWWPRVLAAYNGGPDAVERWIVAMPKAEQDEFVESISYRETRIYVRKVLEGWFWYRKLYGGSEDVTGNSEAGPAPAEKTAASGKAAGRSN